MSISELRQILGARTSPIPPHARAGLKQLEVELGCDINWDNVQNYATGDPDKFTNNILDNAKKAYIEPSAKDLESIDFSTLPFDAEGNAWLIVADLVMEIDGTTGMVVGAAIPRRWEVVVWTNHNVCRSNEIVISEQIELHHLIKALQKAFAFPLSPPTPLLPSRLRINHRLQKHIPDLKQFFASLPPPFQYTVDSPEMYFRQQGFLAEIQDMRKAQAPVTVKKLITSAMKWKDAATAAYMKKDRSKSIEGFTKATRHFKRALGALSAVPNGDQEQEVRKQLSMCEGNIAATLYLEGDGRDLKRSIEHSENAAKWDPDYAKAYYRMYQAYTALGDKYSAMEAMCRALRRPALSKNEQMLDALISLQTDGKGLATTEAELKDWILDIMINDERSSNMMRGVKESGTGWSKRVDEQLKAVKGK